MEKTITQELKRGELTRFIREMGVNDVLRLPIAKFCSARNLIYNFVVEKSEGAKWRVSADFNNKQTVITRMS